MFVGSYLEKNTDGNVVIPFDLHGQLYEVLCVKDTSGHIYLMLCAHDDEDIDVIEKYMTVLSRQSMFITNTVELPREFLEYINDEEVCVYGCGDKIEIYRKEPYKAQKLSEEETAELMKMFEDFII